MQPTPAARIVLLLDSPVLSMLFEQVATSIGARVVALQNQEGELLDQLAAAQPRVLVVRRNLAECSGEALVRRVRQDPRFRGCRSVLVGSDVQGQHGEGLGEGLGVCMPHAVLKLPCSTMDIQRVLAEQVAAPPVVLVVDDSRAHRFFVTNTLLLQGWVCRQAGDGVEALALLHRTPKDGGEPVDLVVSDVEMPNLDGFGLCEAVKGDPNLRWLPVMLVTSHTSAGAVAAGYSVGADDYLPKPVVAGELISRVRRLIQSRAVVRPERVLVVDANMRRSLAVQSALISQGFHAEVVGIVPSAEQSIGGQTVHVLVVDFERVNDQTEARLVGWRDAGVPIVFIVGARSGASDAEAGLLQLLGPLGAVVSRPYPAERLMAEVERLLAESRNLRQRLALRRYLSGEALVAVEGWLDSGSRSIPSSAVQRTTLFADLVGFTRFCEEHSPDEVVRVLNRFFDAAVPVLVKNGASIDKLIGDCVLAVFDGNTRGALGAVTAARQLVDEILPALRAELGLDLHVRIGINSGSVVAGEVGSSDFRRDFTVIGDAVNVAQRIQAVAGVDEVLIGDSTRELLPEATHLLPSRSVRLKGRSEEARIWPVRTLRATSPMG